MLILVTILNAILPIIYGIATLLYSSYFINKNQKLARLASFWLLVGVALHLTFLVTKGWHFRHFPIANSFESLSMLAFDIAIIYYITERLKQEYTTGVFFLSIVLICQTTATLFFETSSTPRELLSNPLFGIHVSFTLLGLSALAISSLYAGMYCILAKQIQQRKFGIIYDALPPLETLDAMRQNATVCGIILFGVGISLGHIHAYRILGHFGFSDPKIITADLIWCAFSGICWWNWKQGVHGLKTNLLSVWLFILFVFVAVLEYFVDTFHRFG